MKKVGIIIPVINCWDKYTLPLIQSIPESLRSDILIVDNASSDDTQKEATAGGYKYIRNDKNIGCAASWNQGVRYFYDRDYDYFLILNNDVLIPMQSIPALVERFERPDARIMLISMHNVRGTIENPRDVLILPADCKKDVPESEGPDFSAFMISRRTWEIIGEFDEGFYPAYFEDNDYHYRIKVGGFIAINYPNAFYYHFGSGTQNQGPAPVVNGQMFEMNRMYYMQKWGGVPGNEKWKTPGNHQDKNYRWTKQKGRTTHTTL